MGQYRYTFRNLCDEEQGMELRDETYKLFFNTAGTKGNISEHLKELLCYMNSAKDYPVDKTDNGLIHKIESAVDTARQDDEWRIAHMTYMLHERDAEKRGEARGEERKAQEIALKMYRRGDSILDIANFIEVSTDTVKKWLNGPTSTPMAMQ